VEVPHGGQRVAGHARSSQRGGFTAVDGHMPAAHRARQQWTPDRLIHRGVGVGPNMGQFVAPLLQPFTLNPAVTQSPQALAAVLAAR
jgi:hypothetical protein